MVALSSYLHLTNVNTKLDAISWLTHQFTLRRYRSNRWKKKANISLVTHIITIEDNYLIKSTDFPCNNSSVYLINTRTWDHLIIFLWGGSINKLRKLNLIFLWTYSNLKIQLQFSWSFTKRGTTHSLIVGVLCISSNSCKVHASATCFYLYYI